MTALHVLGIVLKVLGFTVLGVLGLILLILIVLLTIPIGADAEYIGGEFKLSAKACGFLIQLIPKKKKKDKDKEEGKEKKPKKKKEKKPKKEKPKKEKKKLELSKEELFELVKKVLRSLKKFGKLTVDRFLLHYTAGGSDPCDTASTLGYVNAAICALEPICSQQFRVREYDLRTEADFTAEKTKIDAALCITLRLWQFVRVGLAAGVGILGIIIRSKRRQRREKRLAKKNGVSAGINKEEINENIQGTEERND